jgi:hypothetical protein
VQNEITIAVQRNVEKKRKKGKEVGNGAFTTSSNDIEERLLVLEDFVEKWDEKLEGWGMMISKLYEAQVKKVASQGKDQHASLAQLPRPVQSTVLVRTEESASEKGSIRSDSEESSDNSENSNDEADESAGKSSPTSVQAVETKTKPSEEDEEEDVTAGHAAKAVRKEVEVC